MPITNPNLFNDYHKAVFYIHHYFTYFGFNSHDILVTA